MNGSFRSMITYGFNREPKIRNFIYSFILSLLYFVGVGVPILFGYMIRIAKRISNGDNTSIPPSYRPIKPLIIDGFIVLIYAIILIGIPSFGVISTEFLIQNYVEAGGLSTTEAGILNGLVLGLFISIIVGTFLLPSMLFASIMSRKWYGGFELRLTGEIIYRKSYIKLYLKFIFISFIMGLITRLLFVPIITIPLSIINWFVYITIIGQLFGYYIARLKQKDLDNL